MAINKINNYSQSDSNILELQLTSDCSFVGKHNVSLTNYDSTSESQIAAGSIIEVGGALYKATTDTAISGSPSDGTVYIYMVPSGVTLIPTYTNTAPIWDNEKNGWYGTGGTANYRYVEITLIKNSTDWFKTSLKNVTREAFFIVNFGVSDYDKSVSHGISNAATNKRIKKISYFVQQISSGYLVVNHGTAGTAIEIISIHDDIIYIGRSSSGEAVNVYITLEFI